MNDWKPPLETIPEVKPHRSFLNYIWIGSTSVPEREAMVIRDDDNTPEELKRAITNALQIQSQRGLNMAFGLSD